MIMLIGSHEVSDFDTWKRNADEMGDEFNQQMGIVDEVIYRTMDGDRIVVVNTFDTLENAEKFKAMLESPDEETRAMMEQSGIKTRSNRTADRSPGEIYLTPTERCRPSLSPIRDEL